MATRGELRIGGNYTPAVRHHDVIYVSGQIPRVGHAGTGSVGAAVDGHGR